MPSGMAAAVREAVAAENIADSELELALLSATGFKGVIEVPSGGVLKYQARVQVAGDGRGGTTKRRQHSLPGLFDTAKEAAICRAAFIKAMRATEGRVVAPPKQNKQHKPRTRKQLAQPAAAPPLPPPMTTVMAMPICMPMMHVPFAAVSPLPMQPLCYMPCV